MKKRPIQFKLDKDLIFAIIVGVIGALVAIGMFFLSGLMISQAAQNAPLVALIILVVLVKMFGFIRALARYFERLFSHRTTFTMLRDIRVQFFSGLTQVVPDIYRKFKSSDLISRMVSSVEALQNIYLRVYYPPVVIGITALITVVALWEFSFAHALLLFLSMTISLGILPWLSAKRARVLSERVAEDESQFLSQYFDYKEGYGELQRFHQVESYRKDLMQRLFGYSKRQRSEQRFLTLYDFALDAVSMISLFLCVWLGIIQVQNGNMDVIYLTSIVLMLLTLFEQAVPMSNVAYFKADTDQAIINISEVLNDVPDPSRYPQSGQNNNFNSEHELIDVENVDFKYWNQIGNVLKQINLHVKKGERLAIIGPSGSGKSTLMQVIAGLYQTETGAALLNGRTIFELTEAEKAESFNVMLQHQQLFDGTVRENLLSDADDNKMRQVLDELGLEHVALDYEITLTGVGLSGGELQRLCLARLFLKEAPIWLLDEPTRSLDWDNSEGMMQRIFEQSETLIVATHDLELLPKFDRIAVMIEGELVEIDNYQQLMQQKGYLYDMVTLNE
ncbi:thiol reductant ABC exporter subunit CydC [Staphylococcus carnosus]|uniref:Cysteine ABC transporter ATP-binding protein n=1 Tax=Staphylococcus carnosus TaxID=1281 RepID=A0AAJ0NH06_STACA|nr:thiol reductant ABC exporter subunit CydC [Staphylococcus carnosus]ANZ34035.1 thiol reductant ABC exporter subunit CydC [Staphylococcus carnosus]KKB25094.1 cysteine ABC transporter ATP-binding protein [Staphylococcus carnosus]KOR14222.1 cysteine ABC transporter ATP-binding protein [Staphylococcus carnosus]POA02108.1 thiol reductant ABC exporter subunit CydC [Staphylococcus carnosus]QQS85979.1 thiol reductant ABC exporter subunit CydC [Staphylococcus carnosus]